MLYVRQLLEAAAVAEVQAAERCELAGEVPIVSMPQTTLHQQVRAEPVGALLHCHTAALLRLHCCAQPNCIAALSLSP